MDFRSACRGLLRTPGFSGLIILTLAVCIGATTTMFSVVWAVFLRPLPFPAQNRLVTVWESDARRGEPQRRVTPANFVDWREQTHSFEALGTLPNWTGKPLPFNVAGLSGPERIDGIYASSGFFKVMGVAPMFGRTFGPDEDFTRGKRSVVISYPYWQTRFAADPSVVGRTLDVDTFRGGRFTIVGVMPAGFDFPRGVRIWLSLADWGGGPMPAPNAVERCCSWYTVVGRLKPGVTIERAAAELTTIARRVSAQHPETAPVVEARVIPLRETLAGKHKQTLFGLFAAVGCILLIGCANVANLLLSRGVTRRREVLTRLALGATRWRIARQLMAESLLLGGLGAWFGLLFALWAQDFIASSMAERVPLIEGTHLDWAVLGFSVALTMVTSTICGLAPLADWRSVDWSARAQTESRASRRLRHALVIGEVALAVTLVASAGLFFRTVANLRAVDVGFDSAKTMVVSTDLATESLRGRGQSAGFVALVLPRIAALPGVRAVAATTGVPFEGGPAAQPITRQGDPPQPSSSSPQVVQVAVTPTYFTVMGVALIRGRGFTEQDRAEGALVAVLNETAAKRYWPGEDPLGRRLAMGSGDRFGSFRAVRPGEIEWREIVGVVADIRSAGFASEVQPEVYYSYRQFPFYDPALIVRTMGDPALLTTSIRQEVAATNSNAVITRLRTLDDVAEQSIADPRLRAMLAAIFSAVALVLGMLGIYGVMSYTVAQRTREIGIRMALGAQRAEVVRMIAVKALRLTTPGIGVGLIVAYFAARWISSLFFRVGPADTLTLAGTCLLLAGAALVAIAGPARHAVQVDPAIALRDE